MPCFKRKGVILKTVVSSEGSSGIFCAKKYGFENASTDISDALEKDTDSIVIATRHNLHAKQVILGIQNHSLNILSTTKNHSFKPFYNLSRCHTLVSLVRSERYMMCIYSLQ